MAKFLQQLLNAQEPMFSHSLTELEKATGYKGVDVRLIADITGEVYGAMRELGLEPQHTNGQEFYRALLARLQQDNERLAMKIGGKDADDSVTMAPKLLQAVRNISESQRCWALKPEKARELLRRMPPQLLFDTYAVSSVEKLLDHISLEEAYAALRFSEGDAWLRRFNEQLEDVSADDFVMREIAFITLDEKLSQLAGDFMAKRHHSVVHSKEMGVVALIKKAEKTRGATLLNLSFLLHYRNEIRMYSSFFQFRQANADFGRIVSRVLNNDLHAASQMVKRQVHWRVVQRYFGAVNFERHPEALKPHIHPEDLHWRKVEEQLVQIDPDLGFWQNREYVGRMFDGEPVTVNMLDMALAYAKNLPYEKREAYHFRESLWNEILMRYMGEENLQRQVLMHLGRDTISVLQRD